MTLSSDDGIVVVHGLCRICDLMLGRARVRWGHLSAPGLQSDNHGRGDAFYVSGYAVEAALKARICRTLKWDGFPEAAPDFKGLQSLKTHDLEILLRLSGVAARVKAKRLLDWSVAAAWSPESRYRPIGTFTEQQASEIVTAAKRLLEVL